MYLRSARNSVCRVLALLRILALLRTLALLRILAAAALQVRRIRERVLLIHPVE